MVLSPERVWLLGDGAGDLRAWFGQHTKSGMSLNAVCEAAGTSVLFGVLPACLCAFTEKQKASKHSF